LEVKTNNRGLFFFGLCIVTAYLLPYHKYPFQSFYNDWIVILGVVILFAFQTEQKVLAVQLPCIVVIPLGLAVLISVQAIGGMLTVSWDAVFPVAYFVVASGAVLYGATIAGTKRGAILLCNVLALAHLFAGLLSVAIASLQFIGAESMYGTLILSISHSGRSVIRPYANVAQPNQLALLFCMSIACVWWFFQIGQIRKFTGILSVALLLWGLVLTQSRIGWLVLPAFAFFLWIWRREREFNRISIWVALAYLFLYFILIIALPKIALAAGSVVYSPLDHVGTASDSPRLALIREAWFISLTHPLIGAGWHEFGPQQLAFGFDFPIGNYSQHAHNILLNFAAEIGWPFTVLIFGTLAYWLYKSCFRTQLSKEVGFAALFFTSVVIHSLVEFPLWYAYVLLPTAILMGMVHQLQFGGKSIKFSRCGIGLACLILSFGLVMIAADYRRVVVGFRALGWEYLGLTADEGTTEKPVLTIFPHFYNYFHFAKTQAHPGMRLDEIAAMEKVMMRFGYAPVLMRMSLVYALNNRANDALKTMATIRHLHPSTYPDAYEAWKMLAAEHPEYYASIFNKIPSP
jgi:O-antigen ligase